MTNTRNHHQPTAGTDYTNSGVTPQERQQILLDDLQHEVARLADAIERRNELLEKREDSGEVSA